MTGGVEIGQNETQMAQWLLKNGPISVGLNANAMQFYKGGVSHPFQFLCSPDGVDHGVLIVGFGGENISVSGVEGQISFCSRARLSDV